MTQEEFKKNRKSLWLQHNTEILKLSEDYALSNNPYPVGSIFTDHIGTIKIESIQIHDVCSDNPTCIYYGTAYNKDGSIRKKEPKRHAYQTNEVKVRLSEKFKEEIKKDN